MERERGCHIHAGGSISMWKVNIHAWELNIPTGGGGKSVFLKFYKKYTKIIVYEDFFVII